MVLAIGRCQFRMQGSAVTELSPLTITPSRLIPATTYDAGSGLLRFSDHSPCIPHVALHAVIPTLGGAISSRFKQRSMDPALPHKPKECWPAFCARYGNVRGISHTASRKRI